MSRPRVRRTGVDARRLAAVLLLGALAALGGLTRPVRAEEGEIPPRPGSAPVDCAREAALRVQRHYEAVRDLRARFAQTTERAALGSFGAEALAARGEAVFAKPGRMRWAYEAPEPSLVVSDGETLWIHDPVAGEAQHLPLGPGFLSGAAIQFLLGQGQILDEFRVSSPDCAADPIQLVLAPLRDAPYERLELLASRATGAVVETTVVDLLGSRTRVAFDAVRTNTDPDPELFAFTPPAGTRVFELSAP
jgi:outer membrane lipoprotein carrier protein